MGLKKIFGILLMFALTVSIAVAAPTGVTGNQVTSSRMPTASAANISAIAGNVTEIDFDVTSVTNAWQGYYGDITGQIVLGNSVNQTMYNWTLSTPQGEIYATRDSGVIEWGTIACADAADITAEDTALGSTGDADAANETFTNVAFTDFYVGTVQIQAATCDYAVQLNDETGVPSADFAEVLLNDGTSNIYTALIGNGLTGFDNVAHDFQMIVGENGQNGDTTTTPYYFYVELG